MKQGIHPEYQLATVHCACGNSFQTRSTLGDIHVEICSVCHPFYTGRQKLLDTAGRVERFRKKWGNESEREEKAKEKTKAKAKQAKPEAAAEAEQPEPAAEAEQPKAEAAAEE